MPQNVKISYTATDVATGQEVVGLEFRQGLVNEETVLKQERVLLPLFVEFIQNAQASIGE